MWRACVCSAGVQFSEEKSKRFRVAQSIHFRANALSAHSHQSFRIYYIYCSNNVLTKFGFGFGRAISLISLSLYRVTFGSEIYHLWTRCLWRLIQANCFHIYVIRWCKLNSPNSSLTQSISLSIIIEHEHFLGIERRPNRPIYGSTYTVQWAEEISVTAFEGT